MASSSKNMKGFEMLVRNTVSEAPKFKLHPAIAEKEDSMGIHSLIPPKVLLIHYMRTFYHYPIQDLGTFKMNEAYDALCDGGKVKPKLQHLGTKGLMHMRHMPKNF